MKGSGINPAEALGNAVVLQAVSDFRSAYWRLLRHPRDRDAKMMVEDCEKFFNGSWFNGFSTLDGKALLERLKRDVKETYRKRGGARRA